MTYSKAFDKRHVYVYNKSDSRQGFMFSNGDRRERYRPKIMKKDGGQWSSRGVGRGELDGGAGEGYLLRRQR
jgi:hypothetical protein